MRPPIVRSLLASLLEQPNVEVRALVRDPKEPEVLGLAGPRVELMAFDTVRATAAERAAAMAPVHVSPPAIGHPTIPLSGAFVARRDRDLVLRPGTALGDPPRQVDERWEGRRSGSRALGCRSPHALLLALRQGGAPSLTDARAVAA